ncbi:MAG: AhpC/TSA family protein [Carboxylicivirga sp.]|jgi:thioredoxin-related protein|nr:AhpC/TSA family protein [Carboxylicivirga sp.]
MKNLGLLILLALIIVSCQKHKGYRITGNVSGFPDSTTIYLRNLSTDETFDSTTIINGQFLLQGHLQDEPEQIWLNARVDGEFIYTNLLIGNENITVEGDIKDFPWHVNINGSKTQDDHNALRDLTKSFNIEREKLVHYYFALPADEQQKRSNEIWGEIRVIDDTTRAIRIAYLKSHINTYPGIITLGYLKRSMPKDTVQKLFNQLTEELKASKYAKVIDIYLNEKISQIGDVCHDFEAYDKNDQLLKFSALKGKYVLLDFTTAHCGACIQSIEELHQINDSYSDSLQIVSFYGDAKKEFWLNSLERDSVSWLSLWDGKGRYSETYIKYGVQGFPTFFLIDPQGKIIDKWSGYGKGLLENKLKRFKGN